MKTLALTISLAATILLAACASDPRAGYTFEQTLPQGVRSVKVPIFRNQTYATGVEAELTEALLKRIQSDTGLVVLQAGSADSELRGVITDVRTRRVSLAGGTGLVQELAYTITIDFDWRDSRTGQSLVSRRSFSSSDTFVAARPSTEPIDIGRHGAVQRSAQDIVGLLRGAW